MINVHKKKLTSPKEQLMQELNSPGYHQQQKADSIGSDDVFISTTDKNLYDDRTAVTKSLNNPNVIAAMYKQYSSMVTGVDDPLDPLNPRREESSPIVKKEIANMIYKNDNLKKLYLRQSLKPLENYLSKSKEERADLAKQRVVQTTKRLAKVQELANPKGS